MTTDYKREGDFDSTRDTKEHISRVRELLNAQVLELMRRGAVHDVSKLLSPEKECFDEYTPKLKHCKYGSDEYKGFLKGLKPALDHHYAHNSHHPEHYENGITGMTLLDLVEMMCDWKAAGERHEDGGDLLRSIEINAKRFGIDPQLKQILINSIKEIAG